GIRDFHVTGVQTCALPICTWVGLENYAHIFGDDDFRRTLLITLVYVVVCVVGSVGSGLLVALLLNRGFRGRGVARALVTVPWAADRKSVVKGEKVVT